MDEDIIGGDDLWAAEQAAIAKKIRNLDWIKFSNGLSGQDPNVIRDMFSGDVLPDAS